MSMSFEVFPTNNNIPKCNELIKKSVAMFNQFLNKEKISYDVLITSKEVLSDYKVCENPQYLASTENCHTVFHFAKGGDVYVFYQKLTEIDRKFWNDELQKNENAQILKKKIDANIAIGYSWIIKRTMGQPAIASLYYGYLAIVIAILTNGFIYSDDGAWDYSCFPIESKIFAKQYLDMNKISNVNIQETISNWINVLKNAKV